VKTFNQFITELNKFETAMKAGKLGLKTLKKIGLKSATKKVPVKDIKNFRSNPNNPFTSLRRSAENKVDYSTMPIPRQDGYPQLTFPLGMSKSATRFRHKNLRGVGKKQFRDEMPIAQIKKLTDKPGNQDKIMRNLKNMGDSNRQLSQPPVLKKKPSREVSGREVLDMDAYPTDSRAYSDLNINLDTVFPRNKLANPTTKGIKKRSIPEPKKK
jgi:hypothetical protein